MRSLACGTVEHTIPGSIATALSACAQHVLAGVRCQWGIRVQGLYKPHVVHSGKRLSQDCNSAVKVCVGFQALPIRPKKPSRQPDNAALREIQLSVSGYTSLSVIFQRVDVSLRVFSHVGDMI